MPSRKVLEEPRRLSPNERREAVQRLSEQHERSYFKGMPYKIARRFERMRKSTDDANARMLAAIKRAEHPESKVEQ